MHKVMKVGNHAQLQIPVPIELMNTGITHAIEQPSETDIE
jgi:hypothetical protein